MVVEGAEQCFDGVDDHPFGAHRVDGKTQTDEERLEVVVPGFFDAVAVNLDVVDRELLVRDQLLDVEMQRANIGNEV